MHPAASSNCGIPPPIPQSSSAPGMGSLAALGVGALAIPGGIALSGDPQSTTQMLLELHTREIESFYASKQQELRQELQDNFEKEVAKLRSQLDRDLMEVSQASQRAINAEVENFRMHRLPAITSLLAPSSFASGDAPGSQAPAATSTIPGVNSAIVPTSAPLQGFAGNDATDVFSAIDVNRDGVIDRREFEMAMSGPQNQVVGQMMTAAGQPSTPSQAPTHNHPSHSNQMKGSTSNEAQQQHQQLQKDYEAIMAQLQAVSQPQPQAPSHIRSHAQQNIPQQAHSSGNAQQPSLLTNSQGMQYKLATAEEFTAQLMNQQLNTTVSSNTVDNLQASLMAAHIESGAIATDTASHIRHSLQGVIQDGPMPANNGQWMTPNYAQ